MRAGNATWPWPTAAWATHCKRKASWRRRRRRLRTGNYRGRIRESNSLLWRFRLLEPKPPHLGAGARTARIIEPTTVCHRRVVLSCGRAPRAGFSQEDPGDRLVEAPIPSKCRGECPAVWSTQERIQLLDPHTTISVLIKRRSALSSRPLALRVQP